MTWSHYLFSSEIEGSIRNDLTGQWHTLSVSWLYWKWVKNVWNCLLQNMEWNWEYLEPESIGKVKKLEILNWNWYNVSCLTILRFRIDGLEWYVLIVIIWSCLFHILVFDSISRRPVDFMVDMDYIASTNHWLQNNALVTCSLIFWKKWSMTDGYWVHWRILQNKN